MPHVIAPRSVLGPALALALALVAPAAAAETDVEFGTPAASGTFGEAVVFFDKKLAYEFDYRCKQAGQLASKMRYLSAPWCGMLESNALLDRARHANGCAQKLSKELTTIPGIELAHKTQANAVFVQLPQQTIDRLHDMGWVFYTFIGSGNCRFMCSWATTDEDITALVNDVKESLT